MRGFRVSCFTVRRQSDVEKRPGIGRLERIVLHMQLRPHQADGAIHEGLPQCESQKEPPRRSAECNFAFLREHSAGFLPQSTVER